ncbi:uncharacterized protein LOC115664799 [Syzygium oleosum]|uniref:uncharacterized protein LOC115664799 n=1 Tax=Syzygium oleosum TaxID=219896 RepID=UPI0024B94555|nr:uncharacterized protein LOC115664799 [Syzygium oleosum]
MVDSSLGAGGMSVGWKDFKNARQGDASPHSHHLCEILKAKVNQVHDSENVVSAQISNFLRKADDGRLLRTAGYNKYYGSFLSLSRPPQIKDGSNTPIDVIHNKGLDLRLTLGRNYEENIVDEEPNHASGMTIAYNRAIVDYPKYAHLSGATSQTNIIELNAHQSNMSVYVVRNGGCNAHRTLGCNDKHKGKAIVFGGVKVTANDEAMIDNQNFAQSSEATSRVGTIEPNAHPSPERNSNLTGNTKKPKAFQGEKPKVTGEPHPNAYLLSVPNLLSTGIFDGAPVKYILRRRNIMLRGAIRGEKILCGCNECNNSKHVSSYIFELHAGGRTKHPYNCIYLENGKTVYKVFQELRDTPEDVLFDAIPIIAGSALWIWFLEFFVNCGDVGAYLFSLSSFLEAPERE